MARDGSVPRGWESGRANIAMAASSALVLLPGIERMHEREPAGTHAQCARVLDVGDRGFGRLRRAPVEGEPTLQNRPRTAGPGRNARWHCVGASHTARTTCAAQTRRSGGGFPQFLDFYLLAQFLLLFRVAAGGISPAV